MENAFKDMERHNKPPRGFLLLFFGLIAWGIYYIAAYTPEFSGWSQYRVLRQEAEADRKLAAAGPPLRENPYENDAKAVAEGKGIYREHCTGCHEATLKGNDGPDLTGHLKYGESDGPMYESIEKGRPNGMPAFDESLGRDRIWKVLSYVDSVREYGAKP
jgi:cytochrome c oxidase cbb3-type subunit III